jgi:hypothetical protein
MVPIGCPETSVRNYDYLLRNNPEERSSNLHLGGSLKSRVEILVRDIYILCNEVHSSVILPFISGRCLWPFVLRIIGIE